MEQLFGLKARERAQGVALAADAAHLLTEVGFLAAATGDMANAEPIFKALRLFRPGRAYPRIGLAVALMNAGKSDVAVRALERDAEEMDDEEAGLLDVWRGVALQVAGRRAESVKLLRRIAGNGTRAAELAEGLLGLGRAVSYT
ncbi:hypothetical protein KAF81_33445, partial [Pseudomonas aeruginosa]|uniref:hypothetical protein n=1 Tax=Pseudomonas aeruginosa TaxID=287 RepID=UPI001B38CF21